jgi:hypothetical protein
MPYGLKCCGEIPGACADCLHDAVYASVNAQRPPPKQADGVGSVALGAGWDRFRVLNKAKCPRCRGRCFSHAGAGAKKMTLRDVGALFASEELADAAYQLLWSAADACSKYRQQVCAFVHS